MLKFEKKKTYQSATIKIDHKNTVVKVHWSVFHRLHCLSLYVSLFVPQNISCDFLGANYLTLTFVSKVNKSMRHEIASLSALNVERLNVPVRFLTSLWIHPITAKLIIITKRRETCSVTKTSLHSSPQH